ncbi:hypothetical protein [Nocardioides dongkuii]|uniref:hypothetical protein n=1 Tax=Nocardioides dongkuii TaxID=2760089 RepID=UPI0015F8E3BC|nr:hypothetical protein [Nocardioides dongkuii]
MSLRSRVLADRWLLGLLVAHLVLKVLCYLRVDDVALRGDETAYAESAAALAAFLRGDADAGLLEREVVGAGWFMPGMAVLLTPLFLVLENPSVAVMRLYLGVVSTGLLLLAVAVVRRHVGPAYGTALLAFPGLVPIWVLFSFSGWGDLDAGLLGVVLVALLVGAGRRAVAGQPPSLRWGLVVGLTCAVTLYLRSNTLPLVVGLLGLVLLGALAWLRGPARRRGVLAGVVAGAVLLGLLLPWSYAASRTLGDRVVTTSTVPLSLAVAFGDVDRLCFGPCPEGNIWVSAVDYSREVGRGLGVSELEVQRRMSEYALEGATAHSVAADIEGNVGRYVLDPGGFESRFRTFRTPPDGWSTVVTRSTEVSYFLVLALAVVGLLVVVRRSVREQLLSLVASLALAATMVQPFVHISTSRYWPTFAPLLMLLAVLAVRTLGPPLLARVRGRPPDADEITWTPAEPGVVRWLTRLQVVVIAGYVAVALTVVVLAR